MYKSRAIADKINNAILNLNDGLQSKNVYDIIAKHAESNIRFFEYLSTLDLNVLEKLPQSQLISLPKLEETSKFRIVKDILASEPNETHLIVVNDYEAMKTLSNALGYEHLTKKQVSDELSYQESIDELFAKQSVVIVPQAMIKSSLDIIAANRLIQYQLNSDISDIIQTQNRINRIGQTRETKAYYIATDKLQENIIELFLETYRNIRVAHKGIVELFVDMSTQINVVNDYISKALGNLENSKQVGDVVLENLEPQKEDILVKDPDETGETVTASEKKENPLFENEKGEFLLFEIDELDTQDQLIEEKEDVLPDNLSQYLFTPEELASLHQLIPAY